MTRRVVAILGIIVMVGLGAGCTNKQDFSESGTAPTTTAKPAGSPAPGKFKPQVRNSQLTPVPAMSTAAPAQ